MIVHVLLLLLSLASILTSDFMDCEYWAKLPVHKLTYFLITKIDARVKSVLRSYRWWYWKWVSNWYREQNTRGQKWILRSLWTLLTSISGLWNDLNMNVHNIFKSHWYLNQNMTTKFISLIFDSFYTYDFGVNFHIWLNVRRSCPFLIIKIESRVKRVKWIHGTKY